MKNGNAKKFMEAFENIDDNFLVEAGDYTMKKRFNFKPIIAVAACAAIALAAIPVVNNFVNTTPAVQGVEKIGENGNFTVYESGWHASGEKLNSEHKIEFEMNKSLKYSVDNKKVNTEKTIELNGKKFIGVYQQTVFSPYYKDNYDVYFNEINGEQIVFYIDIETGELKSFNSSVMKVNNDGKILFHDDCYEIAKKFLNGRVNDVDNYKLHFSRDVEWRNGYLFQFNRTLSGITTSEYITIGVRNNGEIYSFTIHSKGAMDNVDVSAIDMDALDRAIGAKINSIYKNNYEINYTTESIILTRLADGTYIFDCEIAVEGKATENDPLDKDVCYFTITID